MTLQRVKRRMSTSKTRSRGRTESSSTASEDRTSASIRRVKASSTALREGRTR